MDFEITLSNLIEEYMNGSIDIYGLGDDVFLSYRKRIKTSNIDYYIYQNGILTWEDNYYYYTLKEKIEDEKKDCSEEEALNIKVYLKMLENIKVIGTDIFEIHQNNKINILNLDFGLNYILSEPVEKINYIFSWASIKRRFETLNYVIIYKNNEVFCYNVVKNNESFYYNFIENKEIELYKIKIEEVLDISEDSKTLIIKNNNKIELFYQGEKKLIFNEFVRRINNFYFLKIKHIINIFNEKGEKLEKEFKVCFTKQVILNQKIIVLKNTKTHKVKLLIFSDDFKNYFYLKEIINLKDRIFVKKNRETVTIFNLQNKTIKLKNVKPKAIKIINLEPLENSNLKIDILEIPYQIKRGKFYETEDTNYKKEYTKLYLVDLKEKGFKKFYLEVDEKSIYKINIKREKKQEYKNKKIEKIFLEKSDRCILGINLFFLVIYRIEKIENNKLKKFYETYREKYFFKYEDEEGMETTLRKEENEYYNRIYKREDLDNLENEIPQKVKEYLQKILKSN